MVVPSFVSGSVALWLLATTVALVSTSGRAAAQLAAPPITDDRLFGGKLLATAGVASLEGAGGGGLTPWALIAGYGTDHQVGAAGFATHIRSQDFHLDVVGAALGLYDRVEFSVAQQRFDTENAGVALGLGRGFAIRQTIVGTKVRLLGNAVLDQDTWLPQLSLGAQYKHNNRGAVVRSLWAEHNDGVDVYLSATKLILTQSLLLNGTLRMTKANQTGLLGFRGAYKPMLEGSVAVLLDRHWVVGAEYRAKPDKLIIAREDDWADLFVAWFPNKHVALTAAYVRLGNIAIRDNQDAVYLSLQIGF